MFDEKQQQLAVRFTFRLIIAIVITSLALIATRYVEADTIPTITIHTVAQGEKVSFRAGNLPANVAFSVMMDKGGTAGADGIVVGSFDTGFGGWADLEYAIPDQLRLAKTIVLRIQTSHANPYFAYNTFTNAHTGQSDRTVQPLPPNPVQGLIPTLTLINQTPGESLTVRVGNLMAEQTYTVMMANAGTKGVGGTVVGTFESGFGGWSEDTFAIPDGLKSAEYIVVRAQTSHANPWWGYNTFSNKQLARSTAGTGGQVNAQPATPTPAYTGVPVIRICGVSRGSTVTIVTSNMPPNQLFDVTIEGIHVGKIGTGDGASQRLMYNIPANVAGYNQLSLYATTSHAYPYYSNNWFWNFNALVC